MPALAERRVTAAVLGGFRASNFAPAFFLMPSARRKALAAVYAFCRAADDAVDVPGRPPEESRGLLDAWRRLLKAPYVTEADPRPDAGVWSALEDALARYPIDRRHLLDLLDGVERDMVAARYRTFEDLKVYCHGVASTVGLACLPLFGLDETSHRDFAVHMGLAVQLINILRDVKADAARDRVYLPREDLDRFGCSEETLKASSPDAGFLRLMRFEAARARELHAAALRVLPPLSRRAARPALAMGALYLALLDKMERSGFPVLAGRVSLTAWEKGRVFLKAAFSG